MGLVGGLLLGILIWQLWSFLTIAGVGWENKISLWLTTLIGLRWVQGRGFLVHNTWTLASLSDLVLVDHLVLSILILKRNGSIAVVLNLLLWVLLKEKAGHVGRMGGSLAALWAQANHLWIGMGLATCHLLLAIRHLSLEHVLLVLLHGHLVLSVLDIFVFVLLGHLLHLVLLHH